MSNLEKNQNLIFTKITGSKPPILQKFYCTNILNWKDDCDCYFDILNTDYPFLHKHSYWELTLLIRGLLINHINNTTQTFEGGDCFIMRPDDKHAIYTKNKDKASNIILINFVVSNDYMRKVLDTYGDDIYDRLINEKNALKFALNTSILSDIINDCYKVQLTNSIDSRNAKIFCKVLVNRILSEIIEQHLLNSNKKPKWLNSFLDYLNSPDSFSKTIKEISQFTPYSYSRLSHLFKEWFNTSIIDYRNSIKLEYAKSLMQNGQNNISEIAYILGFNSMSYFTHLFKNKYGIAPIKYKNNFLKSMSFNQKN